MRRHLMGMGAVSLGLGFLIALAGCQQGLYTVNQRPDTAKLENTLKVGVSTEQDVIAALGPPSGRGRLFVPVAPAPREILRYYFEAGQQVSQVPARRRPTTEREVERTILYVWFERGAYEGYMWTNSNFTATSVR